jgi:uncharacterized membrane protein
VGYTTDMDIEVSDRVNGHQVVASYQSYAAAEQAVDQLSDASFPVEEAEIVGRDLSLVERVTGRVTNARATGAGAAAGAWFGIFIGLLVGLFTTGSEWVGLMLGGLLIGALWGAIFGFFAHWVTHGRRDFVSTRALAADHYDLNVVDAQAKQARQILSQPSVPASSG